MVQCTGVMHTLRKSRNPAWMEGIVRLLFTWIAMEILLGLPFRDSSSTGQTGSCEECIEVKEMGEIIRLSTKICSQDWMILSISQRNYIQVGPLSCNTGVQSIESSHDHSFLPETTPCSVNNGGCSDFCIPLPNQQRVCACPDTFEGNAVNTLDDKNCQQGRIVSVLLNEFCTTSCCPWTFVIIWLQWIHAMTIFRMDNGTLNAQDKLELPAPLLVILDLVSPQLTQLNVAGTGNGKDQW